MRADEYRDSITSRTKKGIVVMPRQINLLAICVVVFAASASAQTAVTNNNDGTTNAVPVYTGSATLGSSPISVSGSNVGIGTTSPGYLLDVNGPARIGSSGNYPTLYLGSGGNYVASDNSALYLNSGNSVQYFYAGANYKMVLNGNGLAINNGSVGAPSGVGLSVATGNVGFGTTTPGANLDVESTSQTALVVGSQASYSDIIAASYNNTNWQGSFLVARRARGTENSPTVVQSGDMTGAFDLWGYDGSAFQRSAQISATVGGTPTAGIVPGQLNFGVVSASGSMNYPFVLNSSGYGLFTGNVGIGTTSPGAALEVNGNVKLTRGSGASITFADGSVQSVAYTGVTCGGDYAESVDVSGSRTNYGPGDVLVLDTDQPGKFLKSAEAYSTIVSGIYSTKPGTVGRRQTTPKNPAEIPMAVVGIVPAKVSAENGPIKVGDLLVTSSTPGYAMKGTDRSRMLGAVVGKAMAKLDSGKGVIEVLVTLQ